MERRTLAIVGASGSGKSTLARCLTSLETIDSGAIFFDGKELSAQGRTDLSRLRPKIQLIFQESASALNPRFTAAEAIAEPLEIQQMGTYRERRKQAIDLMERVGLPAASADRLPSQFSGGQKQRLAIARALTVQPRVLIFDESFSALDLSVRAQMLNLVMDLQQEQAIAYIFVTHDLALAADVADEIAVMHEGRIVERSTPGDILRSPQHAHTQALVAAKSAYETQLAARGGQ